jgi:hypothetical protein
VTFSSCLLLPSSISSCRCSVGWQSSPLTITVCDSTAGPEITGEKVGVLPFLSTQFPNHVLVVQRRMLRQLPKPLHHFREQSERRDLALNLCVQLVRYEVVPAFLDSSLDFFIPCCRTSWLAVEPCTMGRTEKTYRLYPACKGVVFGFVYLILAREDVYRGCRFCNLRFTGKTKSRPILCLTAGYS